MKIVSVNISEKKGTIKSPVPQARLIEDFGIEGDAHAGVDKLREVSLLAQESIDKMLSAVPTLLPGSFAENITTQGLTLYTLPIGTRMKIGECLLTVSKIGKECHEGCEIKRLTGKCVMPTEGIFASVTVGGIIRPGDEITIIQLP